MAKITVVGGGVIGLFSAYYLAKNGNEVVIIDKGKMLDGCSYGNAGLIVPSHIVPLAAPGILGLSLKWLFNPRSPFSIKIKPNLDLLIWGIKFLRNSNSRHVIKALPILNSILQYSKNLYETMDLSFRKQVDFQNKGLFMLFKEKHTEEEELKAMRNAINAGLEVNYLSKFEIEKLDSSTTYDVLGGIHYVGDAHLTPSNLMNWLKSELTKFNVKFVSETEISESTIENNKITHIHSNDRTFTAHKFVFCIGANSNLLKSIDRKQYLVMNGKGYSFNISGMNNIPKFPSILVDARVAVTPMQGFLRIAGTMEIGGENDEIKNKRIEGMLNSFRTYYPEIQSPPPTKNKIWEGLRPLSPDGIPIIGRHGNIKNLYLAGGHSMLGITLGPATGKLIADLIDGRKTDINHEPFSPKRFL